MTRKLNEKLFIKVFISFSIYKLTKILLENQINRI